MRNGFWNIARLAWDVEGGGAAITAPEPAATPAPSPAAPVAADTRSPLARMSSEERQAWDKHGTRPEWWTFEGAKPAEKAEPVTPEPAAAPVANDDDAPAVDAKGQQIRGADGKFVSKRQQVINDKVREAVERGIATERERAERLERELAELRSSAKPEPEAKPSAQSKDDGLSLPEWSDYESQIGGKYADWGSAQQAHIRDTIKAVSEHAAKQQAETAAQSAEERRVSDIITAHLDREAAIVASVPDYYEKTAALRSALNEGLKVGAPLALPLLESPASERLLLHFAAHPEEMSRIGKLGDTNVPAALRELGKLEATLEAAATRPAEPAAPVRKTISDAPAPPTVLGTRSAEPANAVHAAVASRNFRAYDDEMTKRDLARVRR